MRFSESTHREMLIYRFSASFHKTRGNYDPSKIVVPEKVNLEINQELENVVVTKRYQNSNIPFSA